MFTSCTPDAIYQSLPLLAVCCFGKENQRQVASVEFVANSSTELMVERLLRCSIEAAADDAQTKASSKATSWLLFLGFPRCYCFLLLVLKKSRTKYLELLRGRTIQRVRRGWRFGQCRRRRRNRRRRRCDEGGVRNRGAIMASCRRCRGYQSCTPLLVGVN